MSYSCQQDGVEVDKEVNTEKHDDSTEDSSKGIAVEVFEGFLFKFSKLHMKRTSM